MEKKNGPNKGEIGPDVATDAQTEGQISCRTLGDWSY
jgi:hypothetical protein